MYVSTKNSATASDGGLSLINNDTNNELEQTDDSSSSAALSSTSLSNYLLNFTNLSQWQIPASMIQTRDRIARCDIYARKPVDELRFFRDYYFIKFMEGLYL